MQVETREQEITRRRFTVHEYHRMAEAGILHEDDRVELIEGELSEMTPVGARHANVVRKLNQILGQQVSDQFLVDVQNPVRLNENSEPEPDVAVIRPRDYRDSLPGPEDVLFLIEVSDTTLSYDRNVKLPLYARSGIPEVWIFDLTGEIFERHTGPSDDIYRHLDRAKRGETLDSTTIPGLTFDVGAMLG